MMNERIKGLYIQALCEYEDANGVFIPPDFVEKFAELIVRECNSKLDNIGVIDRDSRTIAMKVISEHFGVEEPRGWVCPKCGIDRTKEACPKGYNAALTGQCPMVGVAQ
jgi:hypothetical protein